MSENGWPRKLPPATSTTPPRAARYLMSPEQELVFAAEGSPVFVPGAFEIIASVMRDEPKIAEAFKTGRGVGWHEHDPLLFKGTERFFRPGYNAHLLAEWIPALDGVRDKLERGATVADVGCGFGTSTVLMGKAFPKSSFVGFDFHQPSLDRAAQAAGEAGVTNVRFERALAKDYPGKHFTLVAFSIVCMIWGIRLGRQPTFARAWRRTAPG